MTVIDARRRWRPTSVRTNPVTIEQYRDGAPLDPAPAINEAPPAEARVWTIDDLRALKSRTVNDAIAELHAVGMSDDAIVRVLVETTPRRADRAARTPEGDDL